MKATGLPEGLGGDRVGVAFLRNQLPFPEPGAFSRTRLPFFPRQTMLQETNVQARRVRVVLWVITHRNRALVEWSNWSRGNGSFARRP